MVVQPLDAVSGLEEVEACQDPLTAEAPVETRLASSPLKCGGRRSPITDVIAYFQIGFVPRLVQGTRLS